MTSEARLRARIVFDEDHRTWIVESMGSTDSPPECFPCDSLDDAEQRLRSLGFREHERGDWPWRAPTTDLPEPPDADPALAIQRIEKTCIDDWPQGALEKQPPKGRLLRFDDPRAPTDSTDTSQCSKGKP